MMTSTGALLTNPGLSFPSRTGPRQCLALRAQPAQATLDIPPSDALINVEHGRGSFCRQSRSPRATLGSYPMTMPDIAPHHHRQLPTPSSKSVAEIDLPSLSHTCR